MFASSWGHVDVVKDLPDKGADCYAKIKDRKTGLMEFFEDSFEEGATRLAKQKHGRIKMEGSKQDFVEVVKLLRAHGAKE